MGYWLSYDANCRLEILYVNLSQNWIDGVRQEDDIGQRLLEFQIPFQLLVIPDIFLEYFQIILTRISLREASQLPLLLVRSTNGRV